jgi:ERCC4-type nuclease
MAALKDLTETTNPATVADMFVVGAERLAQKYNKIDLRLNRWFNNISKTHKADLEDIWKKSSKVVVDSMDTYNNLGDSAKQVIDGVLKKGTAWLGPWLRNWKESFRPSPRPETLTVSEMIILLRWTVLHFMAALLTEESANYAAVPADVRGTVIRFFHGWLLESIHSRTHSRSAEVLYNLDEKEIQDRILARKEAEKNMFIDKLDKMDKDMRKVELIKKSLKIGDWAVNTKNLFKYDADFYEFQRQQRSQMGLPEFMSDTAAEPVENRFGFASFGGLGQNDAAYEHRAVHDEDA